MSQKLKPNPSTTYSAAASANAHGKTEFIWDGDVIALEKTAEQTRHYLFEPNSFVPLAQIVEQGENSLTAYYHVDHLGTPQILSDEHGEIAWTAECLGPGSGGD